MKKEVNGQILWGAGDSIHTIEFNATVDLNSQTVDAMKFEIDNNFFDDVLQGVFKAGGEEALRLANA